MSARIVLITGGNKGLGYETARRLKALGFTITIGTRDAERGKASAAALGIDWVQLDVTDQSTIVTAADTMTQRHGHIDVLINNAGIVGPRKAAPDITGDDAEVVFRTNFVGAIRVVHAFLPLLQKSPAPQIVNVSSGLGSFAATHDEARVEYSVVAPLYCSSKAALTMLTTQYAKALPGICINAVDPGFTATDLNDHRGTQSVEEGTDAIVRIVSLGRKAPTGVFVDRNGTVPW
jgi:NAD(P)-dependent dehydrogenase (short-subunit alcohol dehydrogenase family)